MVKITRATALRSSAKIPAPTIAPTPMNAAWRTVRYFVSADDGPAVSVVSIRAAFS